MTPSLWAGVLVLTAGAPTLKEKAAATVVGEWVVEQATVGGKPESSLIGYHWVFNAAGTRHATAKAGGTPAIAGRYTQDPKARTVDLTTATPVESVYLCRYRVDGDTLTLNVGWERAPRPEAMDAPANSLCTLYVMKRVKKD